MPDTIRRLKKWETSGNFARDVMISFLWGSLEWYEQMTVTFVQCQEAAEADLEHSMRGQSARLHLAYEDLGKMFFDRMDAHQNSDEAFEVRSEKLDRQCKSLEGKRKQLERELDEILVLQEQIKTEKAKLRGETDET